MFFCRKTWYLCHHPGHSWFYLHVCGGWLRVSSFAHCFCLLSIALGVVMILIRVGVGEQVLSLLFVFPILHLAS